MPLNNPSSANPSDALPLATLQPSGNPPSRRLDSASQAQDIYWMLHEAALPRLQRAAVVQGNFDGNPPYNPTKRRNMGMAWMPNFNTLEGASRLESAKTPYYDLLSSTHLYADCSTRVSTDTIDSAAASRSRSEHFDALLRTYSSLPNEFWTMFNDYIAFNKGFLWFPRPDSWHFKRLPWHRVLFPDGTSTDPEEWELFAIEHRWTPSRLYSFTKNEAAAKAMGWNIPQVWKAIRAAAPADIRNTYRDPMELQRAFRDQELWLSARIGVIQSASIYTKEFDGTWSQIMVQTTMSPERNPRDVSSAPRSMVERDSGPADPLTNSEGAVSSKDWLLNKRSVGQHLYQILCPFIFETGDGSINDLNGLGKKIISISQATDRLVNETVGSAMMQSTIVLQPISGAAQAKTPLVQFGGGVCVLPSGYSLPPSTIWGNLEAPLAITNDLRNRLDTNTGIYRPQFEKPRGNPETATAAQLRFQQGTVLTTSAVNRFYTQLDLFYAEVYRRVVGPSPKTSSLPSHKAAREFFEACKADGLSERQITDLHPSLIRAVRSLGNGSPAMRQQSMAALAQYVPFMGPRGLNNWLIDSIAAFAGPSAVARYRPIEDQHNEPTQAMREAVSENNDMQTGAQVLFLESDDHEQHAKVHLTAAQGAVQAVQQGADPAMPFTFLQLALPHVVRHISKVPREQVRKALEDAYRQVSAGAKDVFAAAQQQVQQQGEQQNLTFEQQLALQKAQGDLAVSEFKAKGRQELSMKRADQDFALKQQQQQRTSALDDASTAAGITRDAASTAARIAQDRRMAEEKIANERRLAEAKAQAAKEKPKGESK